MNRSLMLVFMVDSIHMLPGRFFEQGPCTKGGTRTRNVAGKAGGAHSLFGHGSIDYSKEKTP